MTQPTTEAVMQDLQVGDRFTEMLLYWVYICHIDQMGIITTVEGYASADEFPEVGSVKQYSNAEEFSQRFRFTTMPGYWVELYDRGNNVERWISRAVIGH